MNGLLLADAFAHHVWATLRIIDACEPLTPEELGTIVPGTYGTILDTLRHTVAADVSYATLFTTEGPGEVDEEHADLPTLRGATEATGGAWAAVLRTELDPTVLITRHRDDGSTSTAPL